MVAATAAVVHDLLAATTSSRSTVRLGQQFPRRSGYCILRQSILPPTVYLLVDCPYAANKHTSIVGRRRPFTAKASVYRLVLVLKVDRRRGRTAVSFCGKIALAACLEVGYYMLSGAVDRLYPD